MYKKYMSLGSPTLVQRACRTKYVCSTASSWSTIMMTAKQFEKTGSVINLQTRKRKGYRLYHISVFHVSHCSYITQL